VASPLVYGERLAEHDCRVERLAVDTEIKEILLPDEPGHLVDRSSTDQHLIVRAVTEIADHVIATVV
jgi:hypothetical protein